jgi:hypothetical protein
MKKIIYINLVFILFFNGQLLSQTFGFGCLGLSGFFAGYSQQQFDGQHLNSSLNLISSGNPLLNMNEQPVKFQKVSGYRIGANFFRADFESVFITAKGYYQFLKEKHSVADNTTLSQPRDDYELNLNHWGLGVDFGVPFFWIFDLKLVEANVVFYNADLSRETYNNYELQSEIRLSNSTNKVGYFIGSGLIMHLVRDYISLEGTAGFNFVEFENFSDGTVILPLDSSKKAIQKNGFSATLQLNIGFPL